MPYGCSSCDSVSDSATTPALTVLYELIIGGCTSPASGGGVDDVAGPLPLEHRRERPAAADHAHQVDVDDPVPLVQRLDVDPAAGRDAGVVDQHVQPAPVLLAPLDRRGPVLGLRTSSFRYDAPSVRTVARDTSVHEHLVAFGNELGDQRGAEPDGTAGDEYPAHWLMHGHPRADSG